MNATADYHTIRTTVGVHTPTSPLVRISGDDRLPFLDTFMSRSADFVDPDTTRECLTLNEDGTPFAIMLHLERDEESWLLPRTAVDVQTLDSYLKTHVPDGDDVTVEIDPEGWGIVAFEGPLAWQVAADFVDFDIAGLVLHGITDVTVPGADEDAQAWLARVGTTGEYGYLLVSDSPDLAQVSVLGRAEQIGGAVVHADGLARVQAEASMPYYAMDVASLDVVEADLAWLVDWDRIGEFHGSDALGEPERDQRRLAPVVASADAELSVGAAVTAGDETVGTIAYLTPAANPDEQLAFAVLEAPFWVPSLPLITNAQPVTTVSLPRVVAQSTLSKIG